MQGEYTVINKRTPLGSTAVHELAICGCGRKERVRY